MWRSSGLCFFQVLEKSLKILGLLEFTVFVFCVHLHMCLCTRVAAIPILGGIGIAKESQIFFFQESESESESESQNRSGIDGIANDFTYACALRMRVRATCTCGLAWPKSTVHGKPKDKLTSKHKLNHQGNEPRTNSKIKHNIYIFYMGKNVVCDSTAIPILESQIFFLESESESESESQESNRRIAKRIGIAPTLVWQYKMDFEC